MWFISILRSSLSSSTAVQNHCGHWFRPQAWRIQVLLRYTLLHHAYCLENMFTRHGYSKSVAARFFLCMIVQSQAKLIIINESNIHTMLSYSFRGCCSSPPIPASHFCLTPRQKIKLASFAFRLHPQAARLTKPAVWVGWEGKKRVVIAWNAHARAFQECATKVAKLCLFSEH